VGDGRWGKGPLALLPRLSASPNPSSPPQFMPQHLTVASSCAPASRDDKQVPGFRGGTGVEIRQARAALEQHCLYCLPHLTTAALLSCAILPGQRTSAHRQR